MKYIRKFSESWVYTNRSVKTRTAVDLYNILIDKYPELESTCRLSEYDDVPNLCITCDYPCTAKASDGKPLYVNVGEMPDDEYKIFIKNNPEYSKFDWTHDEISEIISNYDNGNWVAEASTNLTIRDSSFD